MEPVKELSEIGKKLKKTQQRYAKLQNRQIKLKQEIGEVAKSKADRDRATFIHNLQVSTGPHLRKRDWATDALAQNESDAQYTNDIRAFVFGMTDVFGEITAHLGPMECFSLSRTSRSTHACLKKDFGSWSLRFLARIELEILGRNPAIATKEEKVQHSSFVRTRNRVTQFNTNFEALRDRETSLHLLHHLYAKYHEVFGQYRSHGKFLTFTLRYQNKRLPLEDWYEGPLFIFNLLSRKVSLPSEHNILFSNYSPKEVAKRRIAKFEARYGFEPIARPSQLTYLRYDDLCSLNLSRASREMNQTHPREVFFIYPEDNQIVAYADSYEQFYSLDLRLSGQPHSWKGALFYDLYECIVSLAKRNASPAFYPRYITDIALFDLMLYV